MVHMLLFRFFFYCSGHHRDLHSFPTRRSSDPTEAHAGVHRGDGAPARRHWSVSVSPAQLSADRKSTRLNSSHRTTSYAVFCLKKNNDHYQTPPAYLLISHQTATLARSGGADDT